MTQRTLIPWPEHTQSKGHMGELQWVLVDETQKQDKLGQGTGMSNS